MNARALAPLAAILLASACANERPPVAAAPVTPSPASPAEVEPPPEAEPGPRPDGAAVKISPRAAMPTPQAPIVLRSTPFDYAELPLLSESTPVRSKGAPHYQLASQADSFQLAMSGSLAAELTAADFRTFTHGLSSSEAPTVPSRGRVPCGGEVQDEIGTSWQGFDKKTRSAALLDYVVYHGQLDRGSCRATATHQARVRALAVVPGVVYGFRRAEGDGETLVLIGPSSSWVGSSAPALEDQIAAHVGTFSRLEVPVRRGSSASAMMQITRGDFLDLAHKVGVDTKSSLDGMLLGVWRVAVTVDVVWPASEAAPSVVVTLGSVAPPKEKPTEPNAPSRAAIEGRLRRR